MLDGASRALWAIHLASIGEHWRGGCKRGEEAAVSENVRDGGNNRMLLAFHAAYTAPVAM